MTTPARTIADLNWDGAAEEWRRAIREAEVLGLSTGLASRPEPTRSELEDRFLALCQSHAFPRPEVNAVVAGFTVDFLWRHHRVVAETDGYRYHRGAAAFERDHDRDLRLRLAGYSVLRISYRQVTREPDVVVAAVRQELADRAARRLT